MRKANLTVVAVCATLLWVGTVNAKPTPPSRPEALPATGQTTSYAAGDDGAIKAGAPLSYAESRASFSISLIQEPSNISRALSVNDTRAPARSPCITGAYPSFT